MKGTKRKIGTKLDSRVPSVVRQGIKWRIGCDGAQKIKVKENK
jgi:hypothetical protein